jgi:hypothetical protein
VQADDLARPGRDVGVGRRPGSDHPDGDTVVFGHADHAPGVAMSSAHRPTSWSAGGGRRLASKMPA